MPPCGDTPRLSRTPARAPASGTVLHPRGAAGALCRQITGQTIRIPDYGPGRGNRYRGITGENRAISREWYHEYIEITMSD